MTERWRRRLAERSSPPLDRERIWARVEASAATANPPDVAPSRGRRVVVALVAFAVFLPIAVTGWLVLRETSPDGSGDDGRVDVLFPTWASDERPAAIVTGVLVERDGCLLLRSAGEDHLVLWERQYAFADGAVLDGSGSPVARLGDLVTGGGGYYDSRAWAEEITGTMIPDRCVPSGAESFVLAYDVEVASTVIPDPGWPSVIAVGELPQVGNAVSDEDGLVLLDADGNVLVMVPGFEIVGNAGAPGLWLRNGERYHVLDPAAGSLVPTSEREARDWMYDESLVQPDLPPPHVGAAGHWRYQLFPSTGTASLAQWSGECEVPMAFWIDADGTQTIITGEESMADAPTSVALGWTPGGEALVLLPEGHCGTTHDGRPGIYRFSRPGDGRLVYATDGLAEMWEVP